MFLAEEISWLSKVSHIKMKKQNQQKDNTNLKADYENKEVNL